MPLPPDWEAERASGWWVLHHLIHTPCGWRSHDAYDVILDGGPFDARAAREVIFTHECDPGE